MEVSLFVGKSCVVHGCHLPVRRASPLSVLVHQLDQGGDAPNASQLLVRGQGGPRRSAHGVAVTLVTVRLQHQQERHCGRHFTARCKASPVQSLSHRCSRICLINLLRGGVMKGGASIELGLGELEDVQVAPFIPFCYRRRLPLQLLQSIRDGEKGGGGGSAGDADTRGTRTRSPAVSGARDG